MRHSGDKIFLVLTISCWLFANSFSLSSQETLSLDQCIDLALKNNYGIRVAKSNADIAANDATRGAAGMMPSVTFNTSGSFSNNNTQQEYSSGLQVNKSSVGSSNINSGIAAAWTLFDGMKMFSTYERLKVLRSMGELSLKIQIENTVAAVMNEYCNAVRYKQLVASASEALAIYEEKEKIASTRYSVGAVSKLEVSQAHVDANAVKSQLLRYNASFDDAKTTLNNLLGRGPDSGFSVTDSLPGMTVTTYGDLKSAAEKKNNALLLFEQGMKVSSLELKEAKALHYPKVGLNASYIFSRSENQAGFVLLNQNLGFNAGLSASWNLFSGFEAKRQNTDARIREMIGQMEYEQEKLNVQNSLSTAFRDYESSLAILKLEEENTAAAKENVNVALESYRLGKISSLEFKDIQKNFLDASIRLAEARYAVKVSETELLRISGMLVK